MGNEQYLPQLFYAAQKYQANLLGKNLLIIGQSSMRKEYTYIEVVFLDRHFMHLTGCKADSTIPAAQFFELCLNKRIGPEQFTTVPETVFKLNVLPLLLNLTQSSKMMGEYNGSGNYLYTETLTGGMKGCMGFVVEDGNPFLVPNTVLEEDIRKLVTDRWQVVAIYEKPLAQPLYPHRPKYLAKALKSCAGKLVWPEEIARKISF